MATTTQPEPLTSCPAEFAARKATHAIAKTLSDSALVRQLLILNDSAAVTPDHYAKCLDLPESRWRNAIRVLRSIDSPSYLAPVASVLPVQTPKPIAPMSEAVPVTATDAPPACLMQTLPTARTDYQFLRQSETKASVREGNALTMAQETERRETEAFKASIGERIARAKANRNAFFAGRPNISPITTGADYR